ncbi:MAG: hypothetical protein HPY79_00150 [Bacteroidales bacterium]|nr:hypothetical protein [Bacteroidales bacterium]
MKYFYLIAFICIVWSCNNTQKNEKQMTNDTLAVNENIKPNHKQILYYEGGQIKFVQEYFNGIKHGAYKNWYEDGTIRTLGSYYLGFRKGIWSWYNEKGKIEFQVNYDKQVASL